MLIPRVTKNAYKLIDPEFEEKRKQYKLQPPIVGAIEAILYILALLGEYAGFIVLWVGIKVSVHYIGWIVQKTDVKEKFQERRALFINSLYGNALSILYAVVGYSAIRPQE